MPTKNESKTSTRLSKAEKERIDQVLTLLDEHYSTNLICYLDHENAWQLLVATILSAQCTDARVNIVTKDLFRKYQSIEDFAKADVKELEKDIHSTGFYRNKAKNIIECAKRLVEVYHGEVPREIEDLTSLAGVGRKTANVIRGNIYKEPSIVVDTHVKRISNKLGFTKQDDPEKIEEDLMRVLPKEHWILYNIQIIAHGRSICAARSPQCDECFLNALCKDYQTKRKKLKIINEKIDIKEISNSKKAKENSIGKKVK
ncbi:endonuclease III [Anaeromicropila herbilytica]|uniref:Endonuclease III n=1 Tax=Anaeromicropila herbilytica TaxID=2785025 RepID=A0A7R7EI12_9FIRM|nr:endonuclease III [Anaeromicropila herbilytica]BCN29142.1 endonuclease III [Anaeromicropila herbilytica]